MKTMKLTIIALALCFCGTVAHAQTVSVADVEALPGETVAFTLNLAGGKADTYTAMQFDAQFPTSGFTTTGKYVVSDLWENATAIIGSVDAEGLATIPVASSESISQADVEGLLTVSFSVGSDVAFGEYDVTLTNLWFGYGTSSKDYLDDVTFKVKVVERHTVVLDENSTVAPTEATGVNVRVVRTINANTWSTICLPFDMSEEQVKAAFGDDVELADFTEWSSEEDDEGNIVEIEIGFAEIAEIEANHPCLIKVSSPIEEFTLDGIDIVVDEEPMVQVGKKKAERGYLMGTYVANTTVPEYNLFLNNNLFWYSTGLTTMKAFRAYFELADVLTEVEEASAKVRLVVGDDEASALNTISVGNVEADGIWYTMDGRKLSGKPTEKGIYIVNGKKVMKN